MGLYPFFRFTHRGWRFGSATLVSTATLLSATAVSTIATVPAPNRIAMDNRHRINDTSAAPANSAQAILAQFEGAPTDILTLPNYTPEEDGFKFSNQGMTQFFDAQPDQKAWIEKLTPTLPTLFGNQVCLDAETQPCVVTKAAQTWLAAQVELMAQGLCDGIAAANLMLWQAKDAPIDGWWQTWLAALTPISSYDLLPSDLNLQELIARQTILQGVDELYLPTQAIRETLTPNDILADLISAFRNTPENPYSVGIYRRQNDRLAEGHTLLPYRIEPQVNGEFRVYVYDSNLPPGRAVDSPYITFNTRNNSWIYDPGEASGAYQGDASSKNLDLTRLGWRYAEPETAETDQGLFTCPFCAATQSPQTVDIALIGEGELAVYRLDPATSEYVSVGQGSTLVPFKGGLDRQVPSRYHVTTEPSEPPLKVVIRTTTVPNQPNLTLQVTGSGYTAEVKPPLHQGTQDTLTMYVAVYANGPELTFVADQDTDLPTLGIYLEDETTTPPPDVSEPEPLGDNITQEITTQYRKNVTYSMEISNIALPAGHAVALSVDRAQKRFYFADNAPNPSRYSLNIQSLAREQQTTVTQTREDFPDGTYEIQTLTERRTLRYEEAVRVSGVALEPQTLAYFAYGTWAQVPTIEELQGTTIEEVSVPITYSPAEFVGPTNVPLALVPQTRTIETRLYRGNLIKSNYR